MNKAKNMFFSACKINNPVFLSWDLNEFASDLLHFNIDKTALCEFNKRLEVERKDVRK